MKHDNRYQNPKQEPVRERENMSREERDIWGARWLNGKFSAVGPEGHRFESRSGRYVGTLGKSFTQSCLEFHFSFPKLFLLFLYLIPKKSYVNLKLWYILILFLRKSCPKFGLLFDNLFLATGI